MENNDTGLAETLAREMAKPATLFTETCAGGGQIMHVAVPKGYEVKAIDGEATLAAPRRTKAIATIFDASSFLAYVLFHNAAASAAAVWCDFNPVNFSLKFEAVIDEHKAGTPAWRSHRAKFEPRLSAEWYTWLNKNKKPQSQLEFAEFLEANEKDIAGGGTFPTSLQMMQLATAFEANSEKTFKSKIRLQSGGVALTYVNMDDDATIEQMRLFERFQIGVPVFWTLRDPGDAVKGWPIEARLKYSTSQGKVSFWYDLIRPDIVHERAAIDLIDQIRTGLGTVPMHMGTCT